MLREVRDGQVSGLLERCVGDATGPSLAYAGARRGPFGVAPEARGQGFLAYEVRGVDLKQFREELDVFPVGRGRSLRP